MEAEVPRQDRSAIQLVAGNEFLQEYQSSSSFLIDQIWPEKACGFIAGIPKTYKSWLALDLAVSVVTGTSFLGFPIRRSGPVIYLDGESIPGMLQDRLRLLIAGRGLDADAVHDLHIHSGRPVRLDSEEELEELGFAVFSLGAQLVVIDPLVRFHGCDENRADEIAAFLGGLRGISNKCGTGFVVVHHFTKSPPSSKRINGNHMRGSGDLYGWMDCAIYTRHDGQNIQAQFESRYSLAPDPLKMHPVITDERAEIALLDSRGSSSAKGRCLIDLLSRHPEGLSGYQIREALGVSNSRLGQLVGSIQGQVTLEIEEASHGQRVDRTYKILPVVHKDESSLESNLDALVSGGEDE